MRVRSRTTSCYLLVIFLDMLIGRNAVQDHIRTLSFAIADGAQPGSDGRDYVLRRVLRRGGRYGRQTLSATLIWHLFLA